jgi:hypothetical protein
MVLSMICRAISSTRSKIRPVFLLLQGGAEVLASVNGTRFGAADAQAGPPTHQQRSYGSSRHVGFNAIEAPGCGSAMNK